MAVIQISKIQVRRGLQENLPQLASAELGWSNDARRLFIGNGALSEGAPLIGNTEILTEYTDISNIIKALTFKGSDSKYTSQTGSSVLAPITRTFQSKVDEHPSVRDFGAVGDGVTDDTAAIQRALNEIYPITQYFNSAVRRILYFPAGTYRISLELSVPTYATLVGDGIDATYISQTNADATAVMTFADSSGQISPLIGTNGGVVPNYIGLQGMTIQNTTDNDTITIDSANGIRFIDVKFAGGLILPSAAGSGSTLVNLLSSVTSCYNISFDRCEFTSSTYGITAVNDIYGVSVIDSKFNLLFQGVWAKGTNIAPRAIRITNSIFDNISDSAIVSHNASSIVSAFNYYRSVGNGLFYPRAPIAPVVYFESTQTYSIADMFERTEYEATIYPRIKSLGTFSANVTTLNSSGTLKYTPGASDTIVASSTLANTSLILSSINTTNAIIDYSLTRSNVNVKTGTLSISINGATDFSYEDEFVEYPPSAIYSYGLSSPTGTVLSFVAYGTDIVLTANTNAISDSVILKYNVRRFT